MQCVQVREERKAEYERAFEEHQRQLKMLIEENENDSNDSGNEGNEGEDEEWEGFAEPPAVDYEAEYIDEDKYTTVTVEEMDPSREGLLKYETQEQSDDELDQDEDKKAQQTPEDANSKDPKKRPQTDKPKKKKKFRYESKEERKLNQAKQRYSKARKARGRRGEE